MSTLGDKLLHFFSTFGKKIEFINSSNCAVNKLAQSSGHVNVRLVHYNNSPEPVGSGQQYYPGSP